MGSAWAARRSNMASRDTWQRKHTGTCLVRVPQPMLRSKHTPLPPPIKPVRTLHGCIRRQNGNAAGDCARGLAPGRQPARGVAPRHQQFVKWEPDAQYAVRAGGGGRRQRRHARPVRARQQQQAGPGAGGKQGFRVWCRVEGRGGIGAEEQQGEVRQAGAARAAAQHAQAEPVQAQRRSTEGGRIHGQAGQRVERLGRRQRRAGRQAALQSGCGGSRAGTGAGGPP